MVTDRDEAVVVGGTGPDKFTVYLVFDNHEPGILRSVSNERIRAIQDDVVAIAHIERHERLSTIKSLGPSWEKISKLEHCVVGNGIEIMVAIDQAGQTLLDYVEERVERSKGCVLRISQNFAPSLSMCRAKATAPEKERAAEL
jgi:hypothetical protein